MKILLVEDDRDISSFLAAHLPRDGYVVDAVPTGQEGTALAQVNTYDVCIVDVNLPDCTGSDVVQALRSAKSHAPILILTVTKDTDTKVKLLDCGADDYLVKPFEYGELLARLRALVRRPSVIMPTHIEVGNVTLDSATQSVRRNSQEISLTVKEYLLLEYLMRNRGRIISKCSLIESAWGSTTDQFSDSVDTHLTNLRKKLGEPAFIHTAHGRGYRVG